MGLRKLGRATAVLSIGLATVIFSAQALAAARSDEAAVKAVQRSSYNVVTGNWDVELDLNAKSIAQSFKDQMPQLDYHLVEEESIRKKGSERVVLTFRGEGDQRVVVKLKELESETNVRLRVGLVGNEAKSAELFKYVYQRM